MQFETKGRKNVFLSVKNSAIVNLAELSKICKSKFQNLEKEEKNNYYNKLNLIENLISMLTYEEKDFFFDKVLTQNVNERFEKELESIISVVGDLKFKDVLLSNISILVDTHTASTALIHKTKEQIKPFYIETKSIYFNYVLSGKQGSFENAFVKLKPKKVKFKVWKKGEIKPDLLNEDSLIGKDKFITEAYSFGNEYVYLEATENEITLSLKYMDDKSKDIKRVLNIEELKNFINNTTVSNQVPAVVETPANKVVRETVKGASEPTKAVNHPTLPVEPEAPETAPEADLAGVDETAEVIDDEEQDMLSSYIEETEEDNNQEEDMSQVAKMNQQQKDKICDKQTLKDIVETLKSKDAFDK